MFAKVVRMLDQGQPRAAWRSIRSLPVAIGDLRLPQVSSEIGPEANGTAVLAGPDGQHILPPLAAAAVKLFGAESMVISGFEATGANGALLAQSWFVQLCTDLYDAGLGAPS